MKKLLHSIIVLLIPCIWQCGVVKHIKRFKLTNQWIWHTLKYLFIYLCLRVLLDQPFSTCRSWPLLEIQIFTLWFITAVKLKLRGSNKNNFMVEVSTIWGIVLKGYNIREVENNCFRPCDWYYTPQKDKSLYMYINKYIYVYIIIMDEKWEHEFEWE